MRLRRFRSSSLDPAVDLSAPFCSFNGFQTLLSHLIGWLQILAPTLLTLHDEEANKIVLDAAHLFGQVRSWAKCVLRRLNLSISGTADTAMRAATTTRWRLRRRSLSRL